jgi:radical SAM protein with 4Fe4S-binding SPASM domain
MRAQIIDAFTFVSKLSIPRVWNFFLLWLSYHLSKNTKRAFVWGLPFSSSIEPTTSCNLRCPQCPSGLRSFSRPTGMLQGDLYKTYIDEQYRTLTYLILYFQGEPYLNKGFLDMVRYASDKKIYTATSTNAHYLDVQSAKETVQSGLNRIIISIDGIDQESYAKYRIGGKLEKVLEGTKNLVQAKKESRSKTPFIIWQFIVFKHNENQLPEIKRLAKEYGVDHLDIKSAQVYDYESGNDLIPENEKHRRYTQQAAGFVIKNEWLNHCWRMWQGCVITWDGIVVPCCFDKDATHRLGDLKHTPFKNIWFGDLYFEFRNQLLSGRDKIDICKNCTEGLK